MRHTTACIVLILGIVAAGYWWSIRIGYPALHDTDHLQVHFLDVGQGDAILIETPNDRQILVDSGRGVAVLRELDTVMPPNDRSIDVAILTHPDADHIGGFVPIFKRYDIATVLQSFSTSESNIYRQIESAIQEEKAIKHTITEPQTFFMDGVRFDILWPAETTIPETNAASIVLLITYHDNKILLTGDVPAEVEEFLIRAFPKKLHDVEILKAGHHGSKTSTAQEFLKHTKPNAIIYSAEKNNTYGHPHQEVLDRVRAYAEAHQEQNLTEHYTADGAISFCITPTSADLCT